MSFTVVEKNIAALIGLPIETIRMYSPNELRHYLEKKISENFLLQQNFL